MLRARHQGWWTLALALALASCERCRSAPPPAPVEPPAAADPASVSLWVDVEPPTLNPLVEHDVWTTWITLGPIYETLLREDPRDGKLAEGLAMSWSWTDPQTLRLGLRPALAWHDGQPFGAEDVAATFRLLRSPGVSAERRADFEDLAAVEPKVGEVVLRFRRPSPLAPSRLARLPILPAHVFGTGDLRRQAASRAPVGTGPYRFVRWESGSRILLERNAAYSGPAPAIEKVELRVVRDREAALELARRREIDVMWRLSPSQIERTKQLPGFRLVPWRLPTYTFVVWNTRRPGLGDARVRQALAMLTDRRRYIDAALGGRATIVTGPFPLGSASYDTSIAPWPYDPAAAARLLDQAGLRDSDGDGWREVEGKPMRVSFLLTAGSRTLEPLVTMLQEDLKKAGIQLEVVPTEWAALLDRLRKHAFDASALQWTLEPLQDNYNLFHSSQAEGGQNYGAFADPEVDRLLETLRQTAAGPERVKLDHQLHRLLHERQPYTFLACPEIDALVAGDISGFAPDGNGLGLERLRRGTRPGP